MYIYICIYTYTYYVYTYIYIYVYTYVSYFLPGRPLARPHPPRGGAAIPVAPASTRSA